MPRGEYRAPVRGAGLMTMQEIEELDEQFEPDNEVEVEEDSGEIQPTLKWATCVWAT